MCPRERQQARRRGIALIEVLIAVVVLVIGLGAIVVHLVASAAVRESAHELAIATEGAQAAIEMLRDEDLDRVFASFNDSTADDPDGAGTAPGPDFEVPGLQASDADPDGRAGEILFPGDGTSLREDVIDVRLGMPRDLNADGVVDALDHAADHEVLPVRVRIAWRGRSGNQSIELITSLTTL